MVLYIVFAKRHAELVLPKQDGQLARVPDMRKCQFSKHQKSAPSSIAKEPVICNEQVKCIKFAEALAESVLLWLDGRLASVVHICKC